MRNSLTDAAAPTVVLTIGTVLTLASLGSSSSLLLAAGVVLLVVALLGPDATRLSIRMVGAELTLERQLPVSAARLSSFGDARILRKAQPGSLRAWCRRRRFWAR